MKQFFIDLWEVNKTSIDFMLKYWILYVIMCSIIACTGLYFILKAKQDKKDKES